MIDERSEKILAGLYPPFVETLRQLLVALGEGWTVDEGFRSFAEQDAYFSQGRSRPGALITRDRAGYSGHCYGTVAHVRPAEASNEQYFKLATEAKTLGLKWGGNDESGKFVEMSRVEMVILTMDECLALFKTGQLPGLWAAFDAKLGIVKQEVAPPTPEVAAELKAEVEAEEAVEPATSTDGSEPSAVATDARPDSPVVARKKKAEAK